MRRGGRRQPLGRFLLAGWVLLAVGPAAAQGPAPELVAQIAALRAEKAARTPVQRKLASRLLHAAQQRRGVPVASGVPPLRTGVEVATDGTTLVDLRAEVTPGLLARIAALGGSVEASFPRERALRARLPLALLEEVAVLPEVRAIRPADRAFTRKLDTSEGDGAHRADAVRAAFGVDGIGIRVGVLSDGVDALASLQASGDLPPNVTVLPGQAGSGSEGTAMLEIVHDLAPGAELLFATAFGGMAGFAANILALRAAGAQVIVDDVGYFAEAVLQDDLVADAVDAVVTDGALYFSAAGNAGNANDGTSGVWEGDFVSSGSSFAGAPAHGFGGSIGNEVTADSPFVFTLHWSDAKGASGNDYDLFLANRALTQVVAASTDVQDGDDDPFELIDSTLFNDKRRRLVVVRSAGATRFLHLNANRGRLAVATAGQIGGHPAARGALAVAAVDVRSAAGPGGVFAGSESVQTYSSDGPRRIFHAADGTPLTPGDLSASGGELRAKPDLAAADCVSTASPGFATFCGTSAAAPHAAGLAALLLEFASSLGRTPGEVADALRATALDIEAPGADRDAGAGIADASAAAGALQPECGNGSDDDGDGRVDFPDDPGCASAADLSERSLLLPCDDGADNEPVPDGLVDFRSDGSGDPGCRDPHWVEDPRCQNGMDDDGDGRMDWDGGASAGVPPAQQTQPDPQCVDAAWRNAESSGCGLGFELAFVLPALLRLRCRRRAGLLRRMR